MGGGRLGEGEGGKILRKEGGGGTEAVTCIAGRGGG